MGSSESWRSKRWVWASTLLTLAAIAPAAQAVIPVPPVGSDRHDAPPPEIKPITKPAPPASEPAPKPATEATSPTTKPATKPKPAEPADESKYYKVKRGDLSLHIDGNAAFLSVDPFEARVRFKAYGNPLTITQVAPPGATVKKGDTLIEFDPTPMQWAVTGAQSDLAMAKANLAKAQADMELGKKSDALALQMATDGVKNADDAVKWWTDVDGPQMLESADLAVKQNEHSVEDQSDELDQLHKMYHDEELTSATADIVVKRAVRGLAQGKIGLKMQQQRSEKIKAFDYPINREKVTNADAEAAQNLESVKAMLAQAAVARQSALTSAQLGEAMAERRVADLQSDAAQFNVKSPADGVVEYGQFVDGVWVGGDPSWLKVGERISAGPVMMRVYTPGKLKVTLLLPDAKALWVEPGMKAKVVPVAAPHLSYEATCGPLVQTPHGNPQELGLSAPLQLPEVDKRIVPGMKAAVDIDAGSLHNVLLIPVGAAAGGKVTVHTRAGHDEQRDVVLGKSDGQSVEVRQGLNEGDKIVLPGKKS